jgi:hypothetical protein
MNPRPGARSLAALAAVLSGATAAPRVARADCASGADYRATVATNSVTICPVSSARRCGSTVTLLRQSESDGTVVAIPNSCTSAGCYLDECVPAGSYRYGYATAYDCSEAGCGNLGLYVEATVTATLSPTCAPTSGGGPTSSTATPPWITGGVDGSVSRFKTCPSSGGCAVASSGRTAVRLFDLGAVGLGLFVLGWQARRRRRAVVQRQR